MPENVLLQRFLFSRGNVSKTFLCLKVFFRETRQGLKGITFTSFWERKEGKVDFMQGNEIRRKGSFFIYFDLKKVNLFSFLCLSCLDHYLQRHLRIIVIVNTCTFVKKQLHISIFIRLYISIAFFYLLFFLICDFILFTYAFFMFPKSSSFLIIFILLHEIKARY